MIRSSILPSAAALLLLSACGGSDGGTATGTEIAGGGSKPPSGWNAADACSVVDKAKMAAATGKSVSEASLALVNESNGTTAATSECNYIFADGSRASVMLRWSPIADNSEGAINQTRNTLQQTVGAFGGTVETVDGLGRAAFWTAQTGSLNIFIDDRKFAIINVPASDSAREQATGLARQLGA